DTARDEGSANRDQEAIISLVKSRRGRPGFLLLEDGTLFLGNLFGAETPSVAEVVFTTNMSGYQETFTDPSYRGQIVVMTSPMIGTCGVAGAGPEARWPHMGAGLARELSR